MEDSFFDRHFISHLKGMSNEERRKRFELDRIPEIQPKYYEAEDNANNAQWTSLNKHVWVIWLSGTKRKSQTVIELCV